MVMSTVLPVDELYLAAAELRTSCHIKQQIIVLNTSNIFTTQTCIHKTHIYDAQNRHKSLSLVNGHTFMQLLDCRRTFNLSKCKILTLSSFSSFCRHRTETLSSSIWHKPCTIMTKKMDYILSTWTVSWPYKTLTSISKLQTNNYSLKNK